MRLWQRALGGLTVAAACAVLAPAALASTTPSLQLDQSAGTSAGASHNLGMDLKFTNSGTDSPKDLTINLPPGLLSNAAVDGGACLKSPITTGTTCQIGSGTVSAETDPLGLINLPIPVSQTVDFYLVPAPNRGDLAGLAVEDPGLGEQLGPTGDIAIRPSGNSLGVGATITLTLPDQLPLGGINVTQISIEEINATFTGLRYPTTCPSTPNKLTATVDSYQDATLHPLSAPLIVTGCSSLTYAPKFSVSATKDKSNKAVKLITNVTQGASQAPNRAIALSFPTSIFAPNLNALGNLCLKLSSSCPTVGSVTAASPLYPTPLSGQAYLTGSSSGLTLTLVFPTPFPLTLVGAINLQTDTASFTGLPDIPLTSLAVTLNGGAKGLFATSCQTAKGTATATLTDQNGDRTRSVPAAFAVAGCPGATSTTTGGGGSGGAGGSGGGGASGGGSTTVTPTTTAAIITKSASGLATGHPRLTFKVAAGKKAAKLNRLTVQLPSGLSFVRHRVGKKLKVTGVTLSGAKIKSLALSHKRLVIVLKSASRSITVRLGSSSLKESSALRTKAQKRKLKSLVLKVTARNTKLKSKTMSVKVTKLNL